MILFSSCLSTQEINVAFLTPELHACSPTFCSLASQLFASVSHQTRIIIAQELILTLESSQSHYLLIERIEANKV
jgi:hypothetical protein